MILEEFTKENFDNYVFESENNYAKEIAISREISFEKAIEISKVEFNKTLPNGFCTKDNYFFNMMVDSQNIGMVWICSYIENGIKKVFIYDFMVKKEFRGNGHGKMAIGLMESKAKDFGATSIGLHVFFHNEVAYNLYKKLGFNETKQGKKSAEMEKVLM